jgi:hypothetical protein
MDENAKKIQREIAKDKVQVILSSIGLAVLIIMEFYIMINFKSNFMAMAVGVLLMIVALFFLISALMDMSLKAKQVEQEKYDEIYNAQKASYLVIKKSFDEMEQRLRAIEENSALPAEDIINAQKAVAKVTISRSKENTDALMNSNDELINQLVSIQEKLESSNSQIIEKQQTLLKESNLDIQQKIAQLTSQISSIEGRIQGGIPVMAAQPVQMTPPPMPEPMSEPEPVMEEIPDEPELVIEEAPVEDLGLDLDAIPEEPVAEEIPVEEPEAVADEIGLDIDALIEEEPAAEEIPLEETPVEEVPTEEAPVDDLGLDIDAVVEEELVVEETELELEPVVEEVPAEEPVAEEPVVEEIVPEEPIAEEPVVEEIVPEELVAEEAPADDIGAGLDALLDEISADPVGSEINAAEVAAEEAQAAEVPDEPLVAEEPLVEEAPKAEEIVIPDVGIDLSDPNKVMSPEEIEKLFANL